RNWRQSSEKMNNKAMAMKYDSLRYHACCWKDMAMTNLYGPLPRIGDLAEAQQVIREDAPRYQVGEQRQEIIENKNLRPMDIKTACDICEQTEAIEIGEDAHEAAEHPLEALSDAFAGVVGGAGLERRQPRPAATEADRRLHRPAPFDLARDD